jgi:tetratricopeptide (TPR) repeat protein
MNQKLIFNNTSYLMIPLRLGVFALAFGLIGSAQAAFLDFSTPAREAALGGNGVALPEGTSSLAFNPAGLGDDAFFKVSARYENLFSGIGGDDLSTGNLSAVFPLETGDGLGFSLDHFGSNNLEQDRLQAAFGKSFGPDSLFKPLKLGINLSYLREQFTLSTPLAGVNPGNLNSGAFSVGAGALFEAFPWATLGISAENLNQPNLGVVGVDEVPLLIRYGVAVRPPVGPDRLSLTFTQTLSDGNLESQGGAEWVFTDWGVALRVGGDANMGVAGFGWENEGLSIDYAYQFSWNQAPSLGGVGLPESHLLEVGFAWENPPKGEDRLFAKLVSQALEAQKEQRWKDAYWDYQEASLLKPADPSVTQGRAAALKQYNLQRADTFYQAGKKAEGQGYFVEAQRNYEWAVSLAPSMRSYAEARDRVKKAITQGALGDPKVRDLLEKAVALVKLNDSKAALKKIKEARALYPDDAFLQFVEKAFTPKAATPAEKEDKKLQQLAAEAEIFRGKGRVDLAREAWQEMLKKDPSNSMAKENLSQTEAGGSAPALTEAQSGQVQALLQRGVKAYADGDTDSAVRDWEQALQIDPQNVNALNNLTRVKMEEGEGKK